MTPNQTDPKQYTDTERLEWMAVNEKVLRKVGNNEYRIAHSEAHLKFKTPREAIDAAMREKK